ncbi:MAG: hypothetical protein AAB373_00840 [Patescibacteria group bacterium]
MEKNTKSKATVKPTGETSKPGGVLRAVYLYLVSAITIVMVIISSVGLIKIVLERYVFDVKTWGEIEIANPKSFYECTDDTLFYTYDTKGVRVLKNASQTPEQMETERQKCITETKANREMQSANEVKRDLVWWLSMLIVSLPLYLIHWTLARRKV